MIFFNGFIRLDQFHQYFVGDGIWPGFKESRVLSVIMKILWMESFQKSVYNYTFIKTIYH